MKSAATGQRLTGDSPIVRPQLTAIEPQAKTNITRGDHQGLMGGANAKHAPAVTPIITEDSNPLSDRGRHLPSPPLQAQANITREDHPGLWAEQAPTMLHQSSIKTRTFCPQCNPAVTTDTTISPSNHRHRNVNITLTPKRLEPFSRQWDPART